MRNWIKNLLLEAMKEHFWWEKEIMDKEKMKDELEYKKFMENMVEKVGR